MKKFYVFRRHSDGYVNVLKARSRRRAKKRLPAAGFDIVSEHVDWRDAMSSVLRETVRGIPD